MRLTSRAVTRGPLGIYHKRIVSVMWVASLVAVSVFISAGPLAETAVATPNAPIISSLNAGLPKGVNTVQVGQKGQQERVTWFEFISGQGQMAALEPGGTFVRFDGKNIFGVCADHAVNEENTGGQLQIFAGAADFPMSGHRQPFTVSDDRLTIYKALSLLWDERFTGSLRYDHAYDYQRAIWGAQGAIVPTGSAAVLLKSAIEKAKGLESNANVLTSLKTVIEDGSDAHKTVRITGSDEAKKALADADNSESKLVITVNDETPVAGSVTQALDGGIPVAVSNLPGQTHGTVKAAFDAKVKLPGLLAVHDWLSQPKVIFNPMEVSIRGESTSKVPGDDVPKPVIDTKAVDKADGDQVLSATGGIVTDTVAYQYLVPGTEYMVSGELMEQATGQPTGVTSSVEFTPSSHTGTVQVDFAVGPELAGKSLVVFESLVAKAAVDVVVAEHKDLNYLPQTVRMERLKPTPGTSGISASSSSSQTPTPGTEPAPETSPAAMVSSTVTPVPALTPTRSSGQLARTGGSVLQAGTAIAVGLIFFGLLAVSAARREHGGHDRS